MIRLDRIVAIVIGILLTWLLASNVKFHSRDKFLRDKLEEAYNNNDWLIKQITNCPHNKLTPLELKATRGNMNLQMQGSWKQDDYFKSKGKDL
jgi:hypothetical protein